MKAGDVLRHFKGGRYIVTMFATLTETRSVAGGTTPVTVYMSLQDGKVWVRPSEQFFQLVEWPDGVKRNRFIVDAPDGSASAPCLVPKGLKEAGEQMVQQVKKELKKNFPPYKTECPNCGYPDVKDGPKKGHYKGIYTHGEACPSCLWKTRL
jgi:hypothetical protein